MVNAVNNAMMHDESSLSSMSFLSSGDDGDYEDYESSISSIGTGTGSAASSYATDSSDKLHLQYLLAVQFVIVCYYCHRRCFDCCFVIWRAESFSFLVSFLSAELAVILLRIVLAIVRHYKNTSYK